MNSKVFDYAIESLIKSKEIISNPNFEKIVGIISSKRVWSLGVGKASLVARKFAATLASNRISAAHLHAGDMLHGDFGAVKSGDVMIAFSNSGMTDEIYYVFEKAKELGIITVLITGCSNGKIAVISDYVLDYGKIEEACPLGLTPTTSIVVMLVVSDALAMEAQLRVGLTFDQYAVSHHKGYLGQISREKSQGKNITG